MNYYLILFLIGSLNACALSNHSAQIVSIGSMSQELIDDQCDNSPILYSNLLLDEQDRSYFLSTGELCYAISN